MLKYMDKFFDGDGIWVFQLFVWSLSLLMVGARAGFGSHLIPHLVLVMFVLSGWMDQRKIGRLEEVNRNLLDTLENERALERMQQP